MNRDFEDIQRGIEALLANVEPEHLAHAITPYVLSVPMDKLHRASAPAKRIREDKSDGWRGRVARVLDIEDKARGGELG